ncbi:Bcr/CflA family efflux MFS transporter [Ramlibacter humi]|uniref:Bcr/CflA family efflux transporter n=1 Tax=Ramlibacter humi TaxID=2530451 RepID=A0A4Z0C8X8_9BURK|nr:Bcr/CflA family efflux MFS transporter [Ramlibacter humi]TFZ08137.1 Bcr/CflA family efflux MFS transporter [Ramlibacter humi]
MSHTRLRMLNLVGQLAYGLLSMTICLPSMQDWPATFGASQAAVQLTFGGFVGAYGCMQLVYGPWSDRIGRKPVLMIGLCIAFLGSVMAAFATNLATLTLARVLQGAGVAAGMVTGRAMVQDLFQGAERTRAMALVGMSMGVVPPLATLAGGALHVRFGWQACFVLLSVLAVALLAAAWWGLPSQQPAGRHQRPGALRELATSYATLAREPAFLLYVLLLASTTATFYTFLGGTPLALKAYGVRPDQLGWYIGAIPVAYIFGNLLTLRLSHRLADHAIVAGGLALTLLGVALVIALGLSPVRGPLALALPLLLLGVGHGLIVPPTLAGTVGLIPALAGAAAAVGGVSQQLLGAFGGFAVGLVTHETQVNLGLLMLGWTLLGLAAQLLLASGRKQRA